MHAGALAALDWALHQNPGTPTRHLVLIVIANACDYQGVAVLSQHELLSRVHVSERTLRDALQWLDGTRRAPGEQSAPRFLSRFEGPRSRDGSQPDCYVLHLPGLDVDAVAASLELATGNFCRSRDRQSAPAAGSAGCSSIGSLQQQDPDRDPHVTRRRAKTAQPAADGFIGIDPAARAFTGIVAADRDAWAAAYPALAAELPAELARLAQYVLGQLSQGGARAAKFSHGKSLRSFVVQCLRRAQEQRSKAAASGKTAPDYGRGVGQHGR